MSSIKDAFHEYGEVLFLQGGGVLLQTGVEVSVLARFRAWLLLVGITSLSSQKGRDATQIPSGFFLKSPSIIRRNSLSSTEAVIVSGPNEDILGAQLS